MDDKHFDLHTEVVLFRTLQRTLVEGRLSALNEALVTFGNLLFAHRIKGICRFQQASFDLRSNVSYYLLSGLLSTHRVMLQRGTVGLCSGLKLADWTGKYVEFQKRRLTAQRKVGGRMDWAP